MEEEDGDGETADFDRPMNSTWCSKQESEDLDEIHRPDRRDELDGPSTSGCWIRLVVVLRGENWKDALLRLNTTSPLNLVG